MTDTTTASPGGAAPPPDKHPLLGHAEAIAKLATVVIGVLYVFGIIISNVQLIDLGISDFASLQARNVLIGFFFVLYFAWLLAMLFFVYVIIATAVYLIAMRITGRDAEILVVPLLRHLTTRTWRVFFSIFFAISCLIILAWMVWFTGGEFDRLYSWGYSIGRPFGLAAILERFADAYLSGNNIPAALLILGVPIVYYIYHPGGRLAADPDGFDRFFQRFPLGLGFLACTVAISFMIAGYANDIYPNLRYNLGGGQPQIAKLVLSGKNSDLAGLQGLHLCCKDEKSEQAIKTEDLAIWYQSDKFVYASSLSKTYEPAHVVAFDLKLVRDFTYLPKYAEIHDGNRIVKVYEKSADGTVALSVALAATPTMFWTQLAPDDGTDTRRLIARAVVEDGAPCPVLTFEEGFFTSMEERWAANEGPFPIKVCEAAYPGSERATLGDTVLKPRPADPKKIVVIGDTGCRIAVWGIQDCNDGDEWPFRRIAEKAAAQGPDLIIHVGDYQYREACLEADANKCAGLALGDVWPAWRKDFFEPVGKLLTAAPWVMLRGNHEDMGRAGGGWLRLFAPFLRTAGEDPLPDDVRPYVLRFASLTLAVLDVSNEKEKATALVRSELYGRWMRRLAASFPPASPGPNWLFAHKPLWVSLGCKTPNCSQAVDPDDTLNPVRERLRQEPSPKFDLVFGGDTHMFQFFVPENRRIPPQLVAGMSGTLLEAARAYPDAALDTKLGTDLFGVTGSLWMHHKFGYVVLTKAADGAWSAAFYDPDGDKPVFTCDLAAGALDRAQTDFPCK